MFFFFSKQKLDLDYDTQLAVLQGGTLVPKRKVEVFNIVNIIHKNCLFGTNEN